MPMDNDKSAWGFKTYKNSGFSDKAQFEGSRLLNKEGTSTVRKKGIKRKYQRDLYHYLIHTNWRGFLGVSLVSFVVLNAFFAILFWSIPASEFRGLAWQNEGFFLAWMECFFFSIQSFTTVGFGGISPVGFLANTIASFASFFGILFTAMLTGLTYGRFSRPKTGLLFSYHALLTPYDKNGSDWGLMFRMVHARNSELSNVEVRVLASWIDFETGKRKYGNLPLEMNRINLLSSVWTVVHPITEDSPLKDWAPRLNEREDLEILVFVKGFDDTYSQEIHSRTSYKGDELVSNAQFEPIFRNTLEGPMQINLKSLDAFIYLQ